MNRTKIKYIIVALSFVMIFVSCASNNRNMMRKHRKGKCNCPTFSYHNSNNDQSNEQRYIRIFFTKACC